MEDDSIIKTKLQLIPGIILFVVTIVVVVLKFSGYFNIMYGVLLIPSLRWLFILLTIAFVCVSLIILGIKIIRKNSDYTLFKKTILVSLEFVILFFIFSNAQNLLKPTETQADAYLQKLNTLDVGKGVLQAEVDAVKQLFKDGYASSIYVDMQKGTFQHPQGSPSARPKNLLKIEKLDKECNYISKKSSSYFKKCTNGDLYVKYGWDACFPGSLDCIGDNYFENYLLRNVNGKYDIVEVR